MFDNLNVRNKFLAVAAIPVNVLVIVTLWSAIAGHYGPAVIAAAGAVTTMAVAFKVAGTTIDRLSAVTAAADDLATRLPGYVTDLALGHPMAAPVADGIGLRPLAGDDEFAHLAAALVNLDSRTRGAVEREQVTMSRNLGSMVKNLARRNQSLLDRQIEHIDWLEAKEQDPERLEQLFKLDHLATRMRRTSESVLVLGGAESTRQRGGPAPIADVLRVAMGETEDYRNIRLRTVDEVLVAAGPAFDLAHLLAEVLENATQFSPPESPVELHATALDDGTYQVTVIDRGVGMDDRQVDEANDTVANPPDINLSTGRSVGFIVIGRLARRLGATVELSETAGSGVTVQVKLPASVLVTSDDQDQAPAAEAEAEAEATTSAPTPLSGPLGRLLGLEAVELPETEGWAAPAVNSGRAKPLRARDGAGPAIPAGLKPANPSTEAAAPQNDEQLDPAPGSPDASGTPTTGPASSDDPTSSETPGPAEEPGPELPTRTSAPAAKPTRSRSGRKAKTLAEAIPTGAAFDQGVDALLETPTEASNETSAHPAGSGADTADASGGDSPWTPPTVEPTAGTEGGATLSRRQRGATSIPTSNGPRARASARKPEEIRSMLTRYRSGIKGDTASTDATTGTEPRSEAELAAETAAVAEAEQLARAALQATPIESTSDAALDPELTPEPESGQESELEAGTEPADPQPAPSGPERVAATGIKPGGPQRSRTNRPKGRTGPSSNHTEPEAD